MGASFRVDKVIGVDIMETVTALEAAEEAATVGGAWAKSDRIGKEMKDKVRNRAMETNVADKMDKGLGVVRISRAVDVDCSGHRQLLYAFIQGVG